ncbi:MAG TPA: zeta toxin family protein [Lacunisphaera sp.]|nr:zeta toxin family protein [Lacunisphaera sp.]
MSAQPQLIFLAGPNGAGKSTFYDAHLDPLGYVFLNADNFKNESGVTDREAQSFMDGARQSYLESGQSFVTETVFSDPHGAKLQFLREALGRGYEVHLIYIGLDSPAASDARVVTRVLAGGHDVPADRIPRRYAQSLQNLKAALTFVPNVTVWDNSGRPEERHIVLQVEQGKTVQRKKKLPDWLAKVLGRDYGR